MVVSRCIDELDVDSNHIARALHAALENGRDTELPTDVAHVLSRTPILLHRRSRYHLQRVDVCEPGQNLVVNAVGKELRIFFGCALISERQSRDGVRILGGYEGHGRLFDDIVRNHEKTHRKHE